MLTLERTIVIIEFVPVCDEAPVFHGPSRKIRDGDHVLFWQGEGNVEVALKPSQDSGANLLRVFDLADGLVTGPNCLEMDVSNHLEIDVSNYLEIDDSNHLEIDVSNQLEIDVSLWKCINNQEQNVINIIHIIIRG